MAPTANTLDLYRDGRFTSQSCVNRAMAHIERHVDAELTVEQIAAAAGVRPRRLQQLFQEECGQSPMAYVRALRSAARRNTRAGIGGRA